MTPFTSLPGPLSASPALAFTLVFVVALLVSVALRLWLATRQARHVAAHRDAVPAQFAERIPLSAHRRAADYTLARVRLGLVETLLGAVVLVCFTVLGGIGAIADGLRALLPDAPFLRQVLLVGAVAALGAALDLPLAAYRQFGLEKRFGFNRMTPRLFVADLAKGTLLAVALGAPLLVAVLWLMERAGPSWWLWAWAVWVAFNLAVLVLYHERIRSMLLGVIGRDEVGRRITIAVVVSFVPAAVVGLLAEDAIKERLFGLYPIAAAWMVGGAIVLWVSRTFLDREAEEAEAVD
nr:undecaprenyl-diphosphate phosphatase [Burkholderiaceae bacterium]